MRLLPNKKVAFLFAVVLIMVTGLFVFNKRAQELARNTAQNLTTRSASTFFTSASIDTDGDGLKDWEEALWQTDPSNPDTDGDGTSDGDEVRAGRDPNKAGPDDAISNTVLNTDDDLKSILSGGETLSEQDFLARKFFAQYLTLRERSGEKLTKKDQENLINSFVSDTRASAGNSYGDTYSINDIKVKNDNSKRELRIYANTIGGVLARLAVPLDEHELVVFTHALETDQEEYLSRLIGVTDSYGLMGRVGRFVEVPSALAGLHLRLINDFVRASQTLMDMRRVFEDPITGAVAARAFDETETRLSDTFSLIIDELGRRGVTLATDEPGYVFVIGQ